MPVLLADLTASGPVLTDGAWGTELQARGLLSGEFPDAWNLSHPDRVAEVASAYVRAGSQIILTNTFGANRLRLAGHDLVNHLTEINRRGVELSRQAARDDARVFASIGPSGKLLLTGETNAEELAAAFGEQARVLADAGAEALVIETMSDLQEATAAVKAAKTTALPVVACMVFDSGREKDRTMTGVTPEQAAAALLDAGADAIGANCGQGISGFENVCSRLRAAAGAPIWIKPNAGLPEWADGRVIYRTTPEGFADHLPALIAAGAGFIGGCCGTAPTFIRALKDRLPPRRP